MSWTDLEDTDDVAVLGVAWDDRPGEKPVVQFYLDAANDQCVDYLGSEPETPAPRHKLAEMYQARALQRAGWVGTGNQAGAEFGVTVFPMDWNVQRLLRPETAKMAVR